MADYTTHSIATRTVRMVSGANPQTGVYTFTAQNRQTTRLLLVGGTSPDDDLYIETSETKSAEMALDEEGIVVDVAITEP